MYDIETTGFTAKDRLPVRIIVHDLTHHRSRTFDGDPINGGDGERCGCADWVPIPRGRTRYSIEVAIFRPGRIEPGRQPVV